VGEPRLFVIAGIVSIMVGTSVLLVACAEQAWAQGSITGAGSSPTASSPSTIPPAGFPAGAPTTSTPPLPRPITPKLVPPPPLLATNAPLAPKTVVTLDMFTPMSGVAVAHVPTGLQPGGRLYLVRTIDGGRRWRVSGSLPSWVTGSQTFQGAMGFISPATGYVSDFNSNHTVLTHDGGHTWLRVRVPGLITGLTLVGHSLWVTTERCSTSPCHTDLLTLGVGRLAPATVEPIPASGSSPRLAADETLLSRPAPAEGLFTEAGEGLLETVDEGRTWSPVDDPCQGRLGVAGLVDPTPERWILYCSVDMGMHQGENQLWVTTDGGDHWSLTAQGTSTASLSTVGDIGGEAFGGLAMSGNGQVLWLLSAVGGLAYSTDGGTHWWHAGLDSEGYFERVVTVGSTTEAWLPVPGIGLYRTLNGETWTRLA
jgi:photosystem II stability/assembly factor-like uncharacterized protein